MDLLFYLFIPLIYLGQIPGGSLAIALAVVLLTAKNMMYVVKAWLCCLMLFGYGIYDLAIYVYWSEANIRIDLFFTGTLFYYGLGYWWLLYRENKQATEL